MTQHDEDSGFDRPSLDELSTLQEAAKISGLSASYLTLLVRLGDKRKHPDLSPGCSPCGQT